MQPGARNAGLPHTQLSLCTNSRSVLELIDQLLQIVGELGEAITAVCGLLRPLAVLLGDVVDRHHATVDLIGGGALLHGGAYAYPAGIRAMDVDETC